MASALKSKIHCTVSGLVLAAILLLSVSPARSELKLHFIDVGEGDSVLVQCGQDAMLVDAGPVEAGTVVNSYLNDILSDLTLSAVIATHEHDDHLKGMPDALKGMNVRTVYSSPAVPMSWWFSVILPLLNQKSLNVLNPSPGDSFQLGSATVTFLNTLPSADNANDLSLVVRIDDGAASVLLTADIEGAAETDMVAKHVPLKADILKVAHHGGSTSTSELFLKNVDPRWAVISVGKDNPHGHPHTETLNSLNRRNITVYRTDQFGTVVAVNDGTGWSFEVMKAR